MNHLKRKEEAGPVEFEIIKYGKNACDELHDYVLDNNQSGTFVWLGVRVTMEKVGD